ncbi:hypothetical protein PHLGIDRAFT_121094 [Phlebiopsis gigantea 11061_1 CR5-6]|uniref:Uncharacterized protein n=1 Tax=Phlebiopsis gigantea (strain 11061_1 CR5-6) TaxID=745531 RepID=A0A0C3RTG4_PHLG1|nr:hypothetical protein PHLGIDRAFT_121094 [Phlebiopsis gigantea 11061_1 CR5-6]
MLPYAGIPPKLKITNFLTHVIQAFSLAWEWLLRRNEQLSASNAACVAGRFFNEFLRQIPADQVAACARGAVLMAATHLNLEHNKATTILQSQCQEHKAWADRLAVEVCRLTKLMDKLTIVDELFGSKVLEMAGLAKLAANASLGIRKDLHVYHVALEAHLEPRAVLSYAKATALSTAQTCDPQPSPSRAVTPPPEAPAELKTLETCIRKVNFRKCKAGVAKPTPTTAGPSNRRRTDMPPTLSPSPQHTTHQQCSVLIDEHTN